jgi:hypothetical protein
MALIGICFVVVAGIIISVAYGGLSLIFGIPVTILSMLGLIFVSISKKNFV